MAPARTKIRVFPFQVFPIWCHPWAVIDPIQNKSIPGRGAADGATSSKTHTEPNRRTANARNFTSPILNAESRLRIDCSHELLPNMYSAVFCLAPAVLIRRDVQTVTVRPESNQVFKRALSQINHLTSNRLPDSCGVAVVPQVRSREMCGKLGLFGPFRLNLS